MMSKNTRFVKKRMVTDMRNKAKKDTTFKHTIKKLWFCFTEFTIGFQVGSVVSFFSCLIVPLIIKIEKTEDIDIVVGSVLLGFVLFLVAFMIIAIIRLIICNNKKKNDKIDSCELVKELEYFGIKKDNATNILVSFEIIEMDDAKNIIANEIQSNTFGLKNLTKNDYLFSRANYEFLYSALSKYLTGRDRFEVNSFVNVLISKHKSNYFADLSNLSIIFVVVSSLLFGYGNTDGLINHLENTMTVRIVIIVVFLLFVLFVIGFLLWRVKIKKQKDDFYMSILNQLKEDLNRD